MTADPAQIEATILAELGKLAPGKTLMAEDIARRLAPDSDWHALMTPIRRAAVTMAVAGRLVIYRKGKPVDPTDFKGVWRIGLPRAE